MKRIVNTYLWLTAFSIAMAFLETAVVVYLRKLYYPNGFQFPLAPIENIIAATEFWREIATIIMLIGAGVIAGKSKAEKFGFFLFCFAIWDIFYYIFLKVILDWPSSLHTWDILFLVPVPWVGPVIAPCIISLTMMMTAFIISWKQEHHSSFKLSRKSMIYWISGSLFVLLSFMWDYIMYVRNHGSAGLWTLSSERNLFDEVRSYVPSHFQWWIFMIGELLLLLGNSALINFNSAKILFMKNAKSLFSTILPLMLLSLLNGAFIITKKWYTGDWSYLFLPWNLFLAWIPLMIALILKFQHDQGYSSWSKAPTFLAWLLFFPNAPYIITDIVHLQQPSETPFFINLFIIVSYSWNGIWLGFESLFLVEKSVLSRLTFSKRKLVVAGLLLLCSYGIYLGRFGRWNSWDILANPCTLFLNTFPPLLHPFQNKGMLANCSLFFLLLSFMYIGIHHMSKGRAEKDL